MKKWKMRYSSEAFCIWRMLGDWATNRPSLVGRGIRNARRESFVGLCEVP